MPPLPKPLAVGLAQHRTTTGGEHHPGKTGQLIQHLGLKIAKTIFAFTLEKLSNGATQPLFDHMIRVKKGHTQTLGKVPSNS